MSVVALFDMIAFVASGFAMTLLVRARKNTISLLMRWLVAGLLGLSLFESISNILEWTGTSSYLDTFEDFVQEFQPVFWGALIYVLVRERVEHDLRERSEALRSNLQFLETLIDTFPGPVFYKNTKGIYLGCNETFARQILGKPVPAVVGRTLHEIAQEIPQKWVEVHEERDHELLGKSGILMYQAPVHCADGVIRDFIIHEATFQDGAGNVAGIVGTMLDISERVRFEQSLRASELRYYRLFEDSPIALWEEDLSGIKGYLNQLESQGVRDFRKYFSERADEVAKCAGMVNVIGVNKSALSLYETKTVDEFSGLIRDIVSEKAVNDFFEEIISIAEGCTSFERESIERSFKGAEKNIRFSWRVLPGYEESLQRVVVSVVDITDIMRAEKLIQRRLEFERTISSISSRFVGVLDIEHAIKNSLGEIGRFSGASRVYVYLYSKDANQLENNYEWRDLEIASQSGPGVGHPDALRTLWRDRLENGEVVKVTDFSALPDDNNQEKQILKELGIKSQFVLPIYIGGELGGLLGFDNIRDTVEWSDQDIVLLRLYAEILGSACERMRVEEALLESEERYRTLVEDMPALVCRFLPDGTLTFVNNHYCRYFGKARDELEGYNFFQFIPAEERPAVRAEYLSLTPDKPARMYEHRVLSPDGKIRWQRWTDRALFDEVGTTVEYQSIGEDITEWKRVQEEREELIRELEASNSELEQFTYTVSHDLKSPLITIKGFLGFLEKDIKTGNLDRLKDDTRRIYNAAGKMEQLLNELLELSRIGRIVNPPEAIPFEDLVHEAIIMVAGRLNERGVRVEIAPDLPVVFGDSSRLREVLENLLDNAAKFMGDQTDPYVRIGSIFREGKTVFYVRDNGIGIDPRYIEKVFGLFEKLEYLSEGSGVGLAIVKRIVEYHGGRIWVESDGLGRGSTFYFTLSNPAEETSKMERRK